MDSKKIKKFAFGFMTVVLILSFIFPSFVPKGYIAATIYQYQVETAKRHYGFKIENAEYWDYTDNYDKKRIWIDQGGSKTGEGGCSGNEETNNAVGDKTSEAILRNDDGSFGGEIIQQENVSEHGSSGSAIADALRALKEEIAESKAESKAKYLETALNASVEAESIAIWESEQKAIQRKLAQESIKETLIKETLVVGETLTIPATNYEETFIKEIIPLESIDEVENHIGQKKQIENEEKLDNKIKKN